MPKIGCFWPFSHFFCFWGPFFEKLEPKICLFIHQMWDEISQMTNICHKCTQNGTFKFDQKRNCPLSNARWGGHRGLILEVSKCENGQKMPKREAKPGKIVLFLKITSFLVCRKKNIFSKWMPWHTLMIALFSEKIMWVFPEELFVLNCCPHTSTIL